MASVGLAPQYTRVVVLVRPAGWYWMWIATVRPELSVTVTRALFSGALDACAVPGDSSTGWPAAGAIPPGWLYEASTVRLAVRGAVSAAAPAYGRHGTTTTRAARIALRRVLPAITGMGSLPTPHLLPGAAAGDSARSVDLDTWRFQAARMTDSAR
jgi:hypothetical protein